MISVHNLKKSFGNVQVLKGINIEIRKGECVCIIGPSGSGKSTFLRCLNLLEVPDEGEIIIEGESILEKRKDTKHRTSRYHSHGITETFRRKYFIPHKFSCLGKLF